MNKIQENSFWYVEKADNWEKSLVRAMCTECYKKRESKDGMMFWPGEKGYGDYDLQCSLCGHQIYLREEEPLG